MWPHDPDGFEPEARPASDIDTAESWMFVMIGNDLVSISEGGLPRPVTGDELRWLDVEVVSRHYLGRLRGRGCFAVEARGRVPEGYALTGLRAWLGRVEPAMFYAGGRAQQVIDWHVSHRFCGRCGTPNEDHGTDRAKVCPECGLVSYPRLSPSIIVL
ncbi:MAG: NADH pyrophosphatase zinc ribbon domain-containing protein, partial [Pseudomonadales bacterium]